MSVSAKLWSLTATEVRALIEKDQLTVEEYANALLGRIRSRDGVVKAWKYLGAPSMFCAIRVHRDCCDRSTSWADHDLQTLISS
jgi:hypothetical protein